MQKSIITTGKKRILKKGLYYITDERNNIQKYKPWLGDLLSFMYDRIMEKSIFPRKFGGNINQHIEILKKEFEEIHHQKIIEFATGSGNVEKFLLPDNHYIGSDISAGLLLIARKKLIDKGFRDFELYITDACQTPFAEHNFDMAICNLSLNFFSSIDSFIAELKRILKADGIFFCSVPIPEKKNPKVIIRGTLYSTQELKQKFENHGFEFIPLPYENGALLYFKAKLIS
ncbi:MAG: methyltransferase domain-containing protein [Candidatus Marinimicrobia bacterium]|nr:methyltransferase domain-containing protein [Candidatus Neomarinimicrobiota bacterium]